MSGTSFLNFSMRNIRIARMVRTELNVVRALRLRRGMSRRGMSLQNISTDGVGSYRVV